MNRMLQRSVCGVEDIIDSVFFEFRELTLDPVEPGSICRRPNQNDFVGFGPSTDFGSAMGREVVEDQKDGH